MVMETTPNGRWLFQGREMESTLKLHERCSVRWLGKAEENLFIYFKRKSIELTEKKKENGRGRSRMGREREKQGKEKEIGKERMGKQNT